VIYLPNQTDIISPDIRVFLENLLEDSGMQLTADLKDGMILDLYNRLEKKMIADAVDNLSPDKVEEFIKLAESGAGKPEVEAFITQNIPNSQEVFKKSLIDFRNYFLEGSTTN
jgi:hypothetical protein